MLSEKQWVWIRQHTKFGIIVGSVSVVGLFLFLLIVAIRADNWPNWTGLGKGETTSVSTVLKRDVDGRPSETETTTTQPGKTFWDWLGLLGVPLTLAGLGYVLQRQERERAETLKEHERARAETLSTEQRERDERATKEQREIADNETKEEILQVYFDRLSTLLVDKNIMAIAAKLYPPPPKKQGDDQPEITISPEERELFDSAIDVIRARTLSILRRFEDDAKRRNSVISFLLEAEVIVKTKLNLSGANLLGANLRGANLREANLIKANLSEANLSVANLIKANLSGANLIGATLNGANLITARLTGADFSEATLIWAKINEASLMGVKLIGADLSWANLIGAELILADLSGANLLGADLRGADLLGADLSNIQWNDKTEWPDPTKVAHAKNIPKELKQQLGITETIETEAPAKSSPQPPDIL